MNDSNITVDELQRMEARLTGLTLARDRLAAALTQSQRELEAERCIIEQHAARHGWVKGGPNRTLAHPALHLADVAAGLQRELEAAREALRGLFKCKPGCLTPGHAEGHAALSSPAPAPKTETETEMKARPPTACATCHAPIAKFIPEGMEWKARAEKAEARLLEVNEAHELLADQRDALAQRAEAAEAVLAKVPAEQRALAEKAWEKGSDWAIGSAANALDGQTETRAQAEQRALDLAALLGGG